MSDLGTSISAVSAAGAYAAVRPIDPVRRRLPTADETGQASDNSAQVLGDETSSAFRAQEQSGNPARGGFGNLVGAVTSFFASLFSQAETTATAQSAAAMQAGIAAYARTAGTPVTGGKSVEVLPPSFPKLSSGRAVDLTI